jgi:hypothetical protein
VIDPLPPADGDAEELAGRLSGLNVPTDDDGGR